MATILREKYCKTENFMITCAKGHISLLWKSLMVVQKVLEMGTRWIVRNGTTLKIWGDRWIPSPNTYQVQSPNKLIPIEVTVKELLNDTKTWDSLE